MTRIIAGRLASRRLAPAPTEHIRPTTDRVRESVFSLFAARLGAADASPEEQLAGLAFLDLYAGTGAVGFEAASRGAAPVAWVEKDRPTAARIDRQRRAFGLDGHVYTATAAHLLANPPSASRNTSTNAADRGFEASVRRGEGGPDEKRLGEGPTGKDGGTSVDRPTGYDIVWLDPPYDTPNDEVDEVVSAAIRHGWINPGGWLVIERSRRGEAVRIPEIFTDSWVRRYGDTTVTFARLSGEEECE
ncbi:MAG: RsmD family RNA methyltransferase [Propionibacteriaceae bacterium]|nr:RsmD family RNA methyltransferase [Propionibacteriaceae bacterium]